MRNTQFYAIILIMEYDSDEAGETFTKALEEITNVTDFLVLTSRRAIDAAIDAHRSSETYGPAYHAHKGSIDESSAAVWAGQTNMG